MSETTQAARPLVYDTCGIMPTPEVMGHWFRIISQNEAYLRVFWRGFAHWAELDKAAYFDLFDRLGHKRAVEELCERIATRRTTGVDAFVEVMDENGIGTMVLQNGHYKGALGVDPVPYEYYTEIAQRHPGRFTLLAGIDPTLGAQSVRNLDRCISELGYAGMFVVPFFHRTHAFDECWQPLFKRCEELGAPVWLHSTANWNPEMPYDSSNPGVVDKIAIRYPKLKIMAGHAGWPWVAEMATVAWRHPNVYIEVSAFRPRNMTDPGYGWNPLLYFGKGPLADKIMFGSTWHLLNMPLKALFQEVRDLPIPPHLAEKWIGTNAARLFAKA